MHLKENFTVFASETNLISLPPIKGGKAVASEYFINDFR